MIIRVVEVWNDGHPVVQLESKREHRIINQDQVFQVAIFDDSEIFDEDTLVCLKAVLTIQPEVDESSIWIDQIYDSISILLMTRCEDTDLVFRTTLWQAFAYVGSQIYTSLDNLSLTNYFHCMMGLFTELVREFWRVTILSI